MPRHTLLFLQVCVVLQSLVTLVRVQGRLGDPVFELGFDDQIARHFVEPSDPADVRALAAREGKPIMLFVLAEPCEACRAWVTSINSGERVREMLSSFVVVNAEQNIEGWEIKAEPSEPQVVFFTSDGHRLNLPGSDSKHVHFFSDELELAHGMMSALKLSGGNSLADEFDVDIVQHFVESGPRAAIQANASATGKPIMILIMTRWCTACLTLRGSINEGRQVRWNLPAFSIVYYEGEGLGKEWQEDGHDYVPQAHFFHSDGGRIAVQASPQYAHYFGDDAALASGMRRALKLTGRSLNILKASPFVREVAEQLSEALDPKDVHRQAAEEGKPLVVLVTQPWCRVCQGLIKSVNEGTRTKALLPQFVVVHATGDSANEIWQDREENYIPQVHFFSHDGSHLDVYGPQVQFRCFFESDALLADGMERALKLTQSSEL